MHALLISLLLGVPYDTSLLTVPVVQAAEVVWTPETVKARAAEIATEHALHVNHFQGVLKCESEYKKDAVGDSGKSFGVAQFYQPERDWGVSVETVLDPEKAMQMMAKAWERDEYGRWSCYHILKARHGTGEWPI